MTRVVVFGTFDIFHPGHEAFLKQAREMGDWLLVVVGRDTNVAKAKGKEPRNNEKARSKAVKVSKIADKVILGSKTHNFYQTLRTYKINLIALGYDQKPTITKLKKELKRHRLGKVAIVRLKGYKPSKYKSSLLSKQ